MRATMTEFLRCLLTCAAAVAGYVAISSTAWSEESAASVDAAAPALEDLRAANVARAALAREWQEWQAESERTYALLDTVQSQVSRLRSESASARDATATLAKEVAAAGDSRRRLETLDETFAEQARAIIAALVHAKAVSAPGAVTVPSADGQSRSVFAAAVRALEAAERAASTSSVEIAEGILDAKPRAVTLLRVAGLGWWSEIDGQRAGFAMPSGSDAPPRLEVVVDPAFAQAIRHAIATAQGSRPPELFVLPMRAAAIAVSAPSDAPPHSSTAPESPAAEDKR